MRCLICGTFCFCTICKDCQKQLKPILHERKIDEDFSVFSFFAYHEIAPLLHTKHKPIGAKVYKILAKIAFLDFLKQIKEKTIILPIDDKIKSGYSHTAVLANAIKNDNLKPIYNSLRAKNKLTYSGKSLSFREKNPRNFICKVKTNKDIILLDDLITTGTTIKEAKNVLKNANLNVLFALVLADAKVK